MKFTAAFVVAMCVTTPTAGSPLRESTLREAARLAGLHKAVGRLRLVARTKAQARNRNRPRRQTFTRSTEQRPGPSSTDSDR